MKCLLCAAEIDETREIVPADSLSARQARALELSAWHPITVTVGRNGGQETVMTGHVCPDETDLGSLTFTRTKASKK